MTYKFLWRGLLLLTIVLALGMGVFHNVGSVRAQVIEPQAVSYGKVGGENLTLDVYQPTVTGTMFPAVILIHGGAGTFGSRDDLTAYAQGLADDGYAAFNIDYRLVTDAGSNTWPAQLEDSQLAVRWIRANAATYNVDPDRICALGHSSGGQLAALLGERDTKTTSEATLGTYSSRVACVIDIVGTADPTIPVLDPSLQPVITKLMGGTPSEVPERYQDASPLAQVTANTAPFLIFHGTNDTVTSVEQSRTMVDALHKAGVEVIYAEYPHIDHFDWLGGWDTAGPEILAFLGRHMHPAS